MKQGLILILALLITACSLPTSKVESGFERPTLAIIGAPAAATLYVDGRALGRADRFNGVTEILYIEKGAHEVVIQQEGKTLWREKIFVAGGETKRIEIGAEAQR